MRPLAALADSAGARGLSASHEHYPLHHSGSLRTLLCILTGMGITIGYPWKTLMSFLQTEIIFHVNSILFEYQKTTSTKVLVTQGLDRPIKRAVWRLILNWEITKLSLNSSHNLIPFVLILFLFEKGSYIHSLQVLPQ